MSYSPSSEMLFSANRHTANIVIIFLGKYSPLLVNTIHFVVLCTSTIIFFPNII